MWNDGDAAFFGLATNAQKLGDSGVSHLKLHDLTPFPAEALSGGVRGQSPRVLVPHEVNELWISDDLRLGLGNFLLRELGVPDKDPNGNRQEHGAPNEVQYSLHL